jgi:hypothetical protein
LRFEKRVRHDTILDKQGRLLLEKT